MPPDIGFVLLTHDRPAQVMRLIRRLNRMFDRPPIVVHHDLSKGGCAPEPTANVSFVRPHVVTAWGEFSLVEATLLAIREFRRTADAEWMVLLSGSDYPIKATDRILADLRAGGYDAHIRHQPIEAGRHARGWPLECRRRYFSRRAWIPILDHRLRLSWRPIRVPQPRVLLPFSATFRCFAGSQWFAANRRAADLMLDFHARRGPLTRHYQRVHAPDESYLHCILANSRSLRVNDEDWRFVKWSSDQDGRHPSIITTADLPALRATTAHFARKFAVEVDDEVLDALDRETGG